LCNFLQGAELITHHAAFNLGFLEAELAQANREPLASLCTGIEDTYQTAKNLRRNKKNDIDTLVKEFDILMPKRTLHGTELDAYLVGQIYLALKKWMLH
jgi:DNA polymerase-3 subunit epsilon